MSGRNPPVRSMATAPRTAAWINLWYESGLNRYPVAAHYACGDGDGLMPPFDGWFRWGGSWSGGFLPAPDEPVGWTPLEPPGSGAWHLTSDAPRVGGLYVVGGYTSDGVLPRGFQITLASCILTIDGPEWRHCYDDRSHIPLQYWMDTGERPADVAVVEHAAGAA